LYCTLLWGAGTEEEGEAKVEEEGLVQEKEDLEAEEHMVRAEVVEAVVLVRGVEKAGVKAVVSQDAAETVLEDLDVVEVAYREGGQEDTVEMACRVAEDAVLAEEADWVQAKEDMEVEERLVAM
jgi:hypothetical protein